MNRNVTERRIREIEKPMTGRMNGISRERRPSWTLRFMGVVIGIALFSCPAHARALFPKRSSPPGNEKIPWKITANSLSYDEKNGIYTAKGDVLITRMDQSLSAQEAIYNQITGIANVSGNVRLQTGGDVLTGERGTFDLKKQTGMIGKGRLFLKANHYYITGYKMEKVGEDSYVVKRCRLTTCDGDHPAWSITGKEVKVTLEGYGQVKDATFRVRQWPMLWLPYMIFPAKTKRQTGLLLPNLGYSSLNGYELEVPFFWAISDQTDATFYEHYLSRRGYMQGLEFRYTGGTQSEGVFLFDVLQDEIKKKDMDDLDELKISPFKRNNQTRYWFRGRVDQNLPLGVTARLDLDLVSDQDYLREFESNLLGNSARPDLADTSKRPVEGDYSPTRRSALRLSRDGENYSLQFLSSYHEVPQHPSNDETPQPLAGLDYMLMPTSVSSWPIFFSMNSNYDYIWRDTGPTGHMISLSPEVRSPWRLLDGYLQAEPSLRYTLNDCRLDNSADAYDPNTVKGAMDGTFTLSTDLERTYDAGWGTVKELRHRIWPVLTYEYRLPQGNEDQDPWFDPIDQEGKINRLSLALENFLDARLQNRKGNVSYRQWATLNISQGYNFERPEDQLVPESNGSLTPLTADMVVTPFPDLDLRGNGQWDHYLHQISEASVSIDVKVPRAGDRKDYYHLDYLYQKDISRSLGFEWDMNLAYGFSAGVNLRKNLMVNHSIYSRYWLGYESQCWGARLYFQSDDSGTRVMLGFNLLGLGGVGPKVRRGLSPLTE